MKIFIFILCIFSINVNAEISVSQYLKDKKDAQISDYQNFYITSVGIGIGWANTRLISQKQRPLFCAPDNLVLEESNYVRIIDNQIKKYNSASSSLYIESLLISGLIEAFPCKP